MDDITYKTPNAGPKADILYVFFGGRKVGVIAKTPGGFQYRSSHKNRGEIFLTLNDCKKSLEETTA